MNRMNIINREICTTRKKILLCYSRSKSYYNTLELDSTASAQEIKTAYYKLSLQFHPDKNKGSEESVAKFREITEAYEVLSNPNKKKKYDQEYNFQPHYTSRNFQSGIYSKSSDRSTQDMYAGKTKDFNYDEHFRQHYENVKKQQEIDFEYFKRRWDADFFRRYPTKEEYYRNKHKEMYGSPEQFYRSRERRKAFLYLSAVWTFLILISIANDWLNPDKNGMPKPLYYHVKSEEKDETENSSKRQL